MRPGSLSAAAGTEVRWQHEAAAGIWPEQAAGGTMAYLGGPTRPVRGARPLKLHDLPPGYRPPRVKVPEKERLREERQERTLLRVATVVGALVGVATLVIIVLMVATH
jgi:hypothetical protein